MEMVEPMNSNSLNSDPDDATIRSYGKRCSGCLPKRYILVILGCLGFANVYALRVNLSVALVAMVNSTFANANSEAKSHECEIDNSTTAEEKDGTFMWDQDTQGIILGSFFYGYIFTQLPGGWIATKYGARRVFGYGVLCTTTLTLITPLAARYSLYALIAVRVLEGLGEGVTFPAMHSMWSYWAPPLERTKLVALTYAGSQVGTIFSYPISGLLCKYGFAGGWPSVFYVFGTLGFVWFFAWMFIVYDTPSDHPTITHEERTYIESTVGQEQDHVTPRKHEFQTPWKSIFTSIRVWAIIVAHTCSNWGFYTLLTTMPMYFKEVLGVKISENGLLSAIPYICNYASIVVTSYILDYLRRKGFLSTGSIRKLANTLGFFVAAGSLVVTSFLGCHQTAMAVFMLSLALIGNGMSQSGYAINHLDISARNAGVLMALTNTAGTIPGIISPYIVGVLTNNQPTRGRWQIVFFVAAGIYTFGAIFFLIFASGQEQTWNRPKIIENSESNNDIYSDSDLREPLLNEDDRTNNSCNVEYDDRTNSCNVEYLP